MAPETAASVTKGELWSPSEGLSERVKKLRDEYFSYNDRGYFRNEVIPFISRRDNDALWSSYHWGVSPEIHITFPSFESTLQSLGRMVPLPDDFWNEPRVIRRAKFFAEVIRKHLPVKILDSELIVGAQFNAALSKTFNDEEYKEWRARERKWFKTYRKLDFFGVGNCGAVPGHIIPDYPRVLQEGFRGMAEYFRKLADSAKDENHKHFIEALIECIEAARDFAARYADEAEKLAAEEEDSTRKEELGKIAGICRKVPWEPPETLHEALQSLWFTHMLVMTAESYPGPGLSPGRVDQYLYPYYRADIEAGRIDPDAARELLSCWFIKHNYAYDFMGRVGTNQGINSGFGQLITIGGIGPDGEDASNELTRLLLDIIAEMNMLEPKPNVRLHRNTPDDLLDRVCDILAEAQGAPFLLNFDELSIEALRWQGLPEERLWNYAPVGCLENTLQGDDRSGTVDVNLNLAKPVELVMTGGRDIRFKIRLGSKTGSPTGFKSFSEFMDAYKKQLLACMDKLLECAIEADALRAEFEPTPYLSALVRGCAESGKDVTAGGSNHSFITVEGVGFATAVDSLAAVKKLVFDEGQVSMKELVRAVKKNFKGYEKLRQTLINRAPKYGNDDPEVDAIAKEINDFWTQEVFRRTSPATGRRFRAGYLSWNYWIIYATRVGATPDGRLRGRYLSNGICPSTGADRNGPTAVACSVNNVGLESAPNGASHTITLSPSMVRDAEHRKKLKAFLRGYAQKGGTALQVNIIDPDTLREAQKNPEDYRNLLVRVTGYNAYFVTLGKEIQDEVIARESHRM